MSLAAMVWAMNQKVGNPVGKLILLKLADNANDTGLCWPSLQTIAKVAEVDRSTAIRHIKKLEEMGFVNVIRRQHEGVSLSNHYKLLMLEGGGGAVPPPVAIPDGGGGAVPPGVVAESNPNHPVVEPVIEPPPPTPSDDDPVEDGGGGEDKDEYPEPQTPPAGLAAPVPPVRQHDIEELLASAEWAARQAGTVIRSLPGWRRKLRRKFQEDRPDPDDLFALEAFRKWQGAAAETQPRKETQPRDPDALRKFREARHAAGV